MIFSGTQGIGKATFTYFFLNQIFKSSNKKFGSSNHSHLIYNNSHPNILTINKDDIIASNEIEESAFSVSTPLSKDHTESRFIIFSFESGDNGRIIDGSTSWMQ